MDTYKQSTKLGMKWSETTTHSVILAESEDVQLAETQNTGTPLYTVTWREGMTLYAATYREKATAEANYKNLLGEGPTV